MPGELENPERKYKGFRPRQAASSSWTPSTPTNHATHGLYNNSTGSQWIVVRNIYCSGTGPISGWLVQAKLQLLQGTAGTIVPNQAALPGQHYYQDIASLTVPIFAFPPSTTSTMWPHDFPVAVLPPGWSFVLADLTAAEVMTCSFFWEAIFADELDYPW